MAAILLAYAVARFAGTPGRILVIELFGIILPLQIKLSTFVSVVVAGMTASGTDWLLRERTSVDEKPTLQHLFLPALTAWGISVPLGSLPFTPFWWLAFAGGAGLILLVLIAEYIVADPQDPRHAIVAPGLTALAYVLFLILTISVSSIGLRLFLLLPAIWGTASMVSLRIIHLRNPGHWQIGEAAAIGLIAAELAAVLHYLPISPISFGLALLGLIYTLSNIVIGRERSDPTRQTLLDSLFMVIVLAVLAIWFRFQN